MPCTPHKRYRLSTGFGRRPLHLLGGGIAQSTAGRTHVPEIAADEIA
jgi:hypothetical protein